MTIKGEPIRYNQPKTLITPGLIGGNLDILDSTLDVFQEDKILQ